MPARVGGRARHILSAQGPRGVTCLDRLGPDGGVNRSWSIDTAVSSSSSALAPESNFSACDTLDQFAALIKRDVEGKAPTETDIGARVEAGASPSLFPAVLHPRGAWARVMVGARNAWLSPDCWLAFPSHGVTRTKCHQDDPDAPTQAPGSSTVTAGNDNGDRKFAFSSHSTARVGSPGVIFARCSTVGSTASRDDDTLKNLADASPILAPACLMPAGRPQPPSSDP